MPGNQRPLGVVMVADATPMVLTNLRQLATWADIVLTEADATTSGEPRGPLREGWRELLGLERPELSIVTTQLAGEDKWQRQRVQRDSVVPLLVRQPPDRAVLMLDADEFLDASAVLDVIAGLDDWSEPRRLGLVPLFGAVDRVARSIHCCWREPLAGLRDPGTATAQPYIFASASVARAEMMVGRSPSGVRFGSKLLDRKRTFGVHVTMTEASPSRIVRKLVNTRHTWADRALDERNLNTMPSAGVHHAGWWIADYREPEQWLVELAAENDLRVAGALLPEDHLLALRAWAEARLDPRVPDGVVAAVDVYVATRPIDADDFLLPLSEYLMERAPACIGQPRQDPAACDADRSDE